MTDLSSLNDSAKSQLTAGDFAAYEMYRDELIEENNPDIDEILVGHIWGMLECYGEQEAED